MALDVLEQSKTLDHFSENSINQRIEQILAGTSLPYGHSAAGADNPAPGPADKSSAQSRRPARPRNPKRNGRAAGAGLAAATITATVPVSEVVALSTEVLPPRSQPDRLASTKAPVVEVAVAVVAAEEKETVSRFKDPVLSQEQEVALRFFLASLKERENDLGCAVASNLDRLVADLWQKWLEYLKADLGQKAILNLEYSLGCIAAPSGVTTVTVEVGRALGEIFAAAAAAEAAVAGQNAIKALLELERHPAVERYRSYKRIVSLFPDTVNQIGKW